MTIKEGAKKLRKWWANGEMHTKNITASGSFRIDGRDVYSYYTCICHLLSIHDLVVDYTYKGGTVTTQRVIRAIASSFGLSTDCWTAGTVYHNVV